MDPVNSISETFGQCEDISPKACRQPSLVSTLTVRKARLEADLANVSAALEALNKNPEVANVLELVARAR